MDKLLTEKIKQEINYLAHEIVVPITGKPSTPYEINSIRKYEAELELLIDHIEPLIRADERKKILSQVHTQIKYYLELDIPFEPKKKRTVKGVVIRRSRAEFRTAFVDDMAGEGEDAISDLWNYLASLEGELQSIKGELPEQEGK